MIFLILYLSFGFIMGLGITAYALITDADFRKFIIKKKWKGIIRIIISIIISTIIWPVEVYAGVKELRKLIKELNEEWLKTKKKMFE